MLRAILTIGFFLLSAHAAQASCPTLSSLDDENDNCNANGKYVDAGISCFVEFENQVKKNAGQALAKMQSSNKKFVMGDKNSQASGLAGAAADFQVSEATLDALIAAGKIAQQSLGGYSRNIYFPEEWDAPQEMIGNGLDYLNSSPCYAEPRDMLKDMGKRTSQYIKDLEKTKAAIVAMRGLTNQRDSNLDAVSAARKPASATRAQGSVYKVKKTPKSKSTVTGVKEDLEKRSK